jgi:hypothetical protein
MRLSPYRPESGNGHIVKEELAIARRDVVRSMGHSTDENNAPILEHKSILDDHLESRKSGFRHLGALIQSMRCGLHDGLEALGLDQ